MCNKRVIGRCYTPPNFLFIERVSFFLFFSILSFFGVNVSSGSWTILQLKVPLFSFFVKDVFLVVTTAIMSKSENDQKVPKKPVIGYAKSFYVNQLVFSKGLDDRSTVVR